MEKVKWLFIRFLEKHKIWDFFYFLQNKMRTNKQIQSYQESALKLESIFEQVREYIFNTKWNLTEYQVQQYILSKFEEYNMITDKEPPIVSFGENTWLVHYFPDLKKSKTLKPETLILIDIWVRSKIPNSPFADITQMFYFGRQVPSSIKKIRNTVIEVRDSVIEFIKKSLKKRIIPTGNQIQTWTKTFLIKKWFENKMNHYIWHSIWTRSPHGKYLHLNYKNNDQLLQNVWYTIEPWIYFENNFGLRSEMNFYIDENYKFISTTKLQKEITLI